MGNDFLKCCIDQDTPFDYPVREEVSEIPGRILDGMYDIIISEMLSRAIRGECEFALVVSETDSNNEPESLLMEGVQPHSHLSPKIVLIANQG